VREERGIPGRLPLVFGDGVVGRTIASINNELVRVWRGLFSYQMFFVVEPLPSLGICCRRRATSPRPAAKPGNAAWRSGDVVRNGALDRHPLIACTTVG
jgi:hypothetical protein